VTFTPNVVGSVFSTLYISDNADNSPQSITLNAAAVPPVTPAGTYWLDVDGTTGAGYSRAAQLSVTVQ
jgi:hypothetical protein